jgi:hypothetical protein
MRLLSSARMRRRLLWGGLFALVAGGVAGLVLLFPSPPPPKEAEMTTIEGDVVKIPKAHAFYPREGKILEVAQQFVATAVTRKHTADSWDLVCPSLKKGYTRKSWAKGDIPVVPFPVATGKWRLGYSFAHEVDLQVALFPPKKSEVRPAVFDLTLSRCKQDGVRRWLVSSFVPAPGPGGDAGSRSSRFSFLNPTGPPPPPPKRSGTIWLLLPAGIFSLLLLAVGVIGFRSWRSRQLYRAYFRERQISSTRPS